MDRFNNFSYKSLIIPLIVQLNPFMGKEVVNRVLRPGEKQTLQIYVSNNQFLGREGLAKT